MKKLFESEFSYDKNKCNSNIPLQTALDTTDYDLYEKILDFVEKYINDNKLIHYGITAI